MEGALPNPYWVIVLYFILVMGLYLYEMNRWEMEIDMYLYSIYLFIFRE